MKSKDTAEDPQAPRTLVKVLKFKDTRPPARQVWDFHILIKILIPNSPSSFVAVCWLCIHMRLLQCFLIFGETICRAVQ